MVVFRAQNWLQIKKTTYLALQRQIGGVKTPTVLQQLEHKEPESEPSLECNQEI